MNMQKTLVLIVVLSTLLLSACSLADIELGHGDDHDHDGDGVQDHAAEDHDDDELENNHTEEEVQNTESVI